MTEWLHFHFSLSCIGEGNSIPLQCSCLENPKDGGAWWAAVYGVSQSRTWLKRLSSSSRQYIKNRDITLPTKVHLVKVFVFSVVMYGYESCTIKKAERQRIDAFELWCWRRLLRVCPLDCKEIQPVHPKVDQSWVFIGRTDVEAQTPILWPPHEKSWLIWKDPDSGKDWGQKEKGTTEDEMVGWHYRLNGHESG